MYEISSCHCYCHIDVNMQVQHIINLVAASSCWKSVIRKLPSHCSTMLDQGQHCFIIACYVQNLQFWIANPQGQTSTDSLCSCFWCAQTVLWLSAWMSLCTVVKKMNPFTISILAMHAMQATRNTNSTQWSVLIDWHQPLNSLLRNAAELCTHSWLHKI